MPARATAASSETRLLHVRVQPGARRDEILGWQGDALRVRVTAPPADGQANHAVTALLAHALGIAPSRIVLVRGAASRDKLFRVERLSPSDVRSRLSPSPRGRGQGEGVQGEGLVGEGPPR